MKNMPLHCCLVFFVCTFENRNEYSIENIQTVSLHPNNVFTLPGKWPGKTTKNNTKTADRFLYIVYSIKPVVPTESHSMFVFSSMLEHCFNRLCSADCSAVAVDALMPVMTCFSIICQVNDTSHKAYTAVGCRLQIDNFYTFLSRRTVRFICTITTRGTNAGLTLSKNLICSDHCSTHRVRWVSVT